MPSESTDLHQNDDFKAEIADINREFLRLLIHPAVGGVREILGIEADLLHRLWELTPSELERIASLPLLLPEFHPFPLSSGVRDADWPAADRCQDKAWQTEKHDFANRLLTTIWHNARKNQWRTALYAGISRGHCRALAEMNFSSFSRCTHQAGNLLRVRLCQHDGYWHDLLRSIRKGDNNQQTATRLALIPLTIAQQWSTAASVPGPEYL